MRIGKPLKLKPADPELDSDVHKIVEIFRNKGYGIDYETAKAAWQLYSDSMCASWLMVEDDEYVFYSVMQYLTEDLSDY